MHLTGALQRRRDRDRPGAAHHADAAQGEGRREVRRVLRPRRGVAAGRRSRDDRQHGAGIRRDDGLLRRGRGNRRPICAAPAARDEHCRGVRKLLQGAGPLGHPAARARSTTASISNSISRPSCPASPARSARRIASSCRDSKNTFTRLFTKAVPDGGYGKTADDLAHASAGAHQRRHADGSAGALLHRCADDDTHMAEGTPRHVAGDGHQPPDARRRRTICTRHAPTDRPTCRSATAACSSPRSRAARTPATRASCSPPVCWRRRPSSTASRVNPAVKTSLGPGSRVVTDYLDKTGLQPYLDQLGFQTVGYGCTTCIGNSGPLHPAHRGSDHQERSRRRQRALAATATSRRACTRTSRRTSSCRRRSSSPSRSRARVDIDLTQRAARQGHATAQHVFLTRHLAERSRKSATRCSTALKPEVFRRLYTDFADAESEVERDPLHRRRRLRVGRRKHLHPGAAVLHRLLAWSPATSREIKGARAARHLRRLASRPTTSRPPARSRRPRPPAHYLIEHGVAFEDFNCYGSRRGNDRVMTRGTFANVRIKNLMVPGVEGGVTKLPARRRA